MRSPPFLPAILPEHTIFVLYFLSVLDMGRLTEAWDAPSTFFRSGVGQCIDFVKNMLLLPLMI
jgi:hypothetical protein